MEWQDTVKIGIPIVLLIGGGFISYGRLQGKIGEIDNRLTDFKKDVDDFKKDIKEDIREIKKDVDDFKKDMKEDIREMRNNIQDLNNNLMSLLGKSVLLQKKSPITLTPLGNDVAKYISADVLVKKYAGKLTINETATHYEVQKACFEFVENQLPDLLEPAEKRTVEKVAYNKGMTVKEILEVMGVKLRDKFLAERNLTPPA